MTKPFAQLLLKSIVGVHAAATALDVLPGLGQCHFALLYEVRHHQRGAARDTGHTMHEHDAAAYNRRVNEAAGAREELVNVRVRLVVHVNGQVGEIVRELVGFPRGIHNVRNFALLQLSEATSTPVKYRHDGSISVHSSPVTGRANSYIVFLLSKR